MYVSPWYVAIRKKRSPMVCKAIDMCEVMQEDSNLADLLPGFRLEDTVTTMGRPGLTGVGLLHPNRSITLVSLGPNNKD